MASELADMLRRRAAILLQRRAIGDHEDGRRMNNAADALDARDRDVAELVAALDEARDKFWVFRCNFGKQTPERQLCEKLCADFAVLLAKHEGCA